MNRSRCSHHCLPNGPPNTRTSLRPGLAGHWSQWPSFRQVGCDPGSFRRRVEGSRWTEWRWAPHGPACATSWCVLRLRLRPTRPFRRRYCRASRLIETRLQPYPTCHIRAAYCRQCWPTAGQRADETRQLLQHHAIRHIQHLTSRNHLPVMNNVYGTLSSCYWINILVFGIETIRVVALIQSGGHKTK